MIDQIDNQSFITSENQPTATCTKEQFAALMHGKDLWASEELGEPFLREQSDLLTTNKLVVAYHTQPNSVEVWGAGIGFQTLTWSGDSHDVNGEKTIWFNSTGIVMEPPMEATGKWAKEMRLQVHQCRPEAARVILSQVQCEDAFGERRIWEMKANIPFASFDITGFGGLVGRGVVLSMEDFPRCSVPEVQEQIDSLSLTINENTNPIDETTGSRSR